MGQTGYLTPDTHKMVVSTWFWLTVDFLGTCHIFRGKNRVIPTLKHYSDIVSECFWHTIWKYIWHIHFDYCNLLYLLYLASVLTYFLAFILTFFLAFSLASILASFQAFFLASLPTFWFSLTFFLAFYYIILYLASIPTFFLWRSIWHSLWRLAEVRQCPLRSGARGWGPAVPTQIFSMHSSAESEAAGGEWREGGEGGGNNTDKI